MEWKIKISNITNQRIVVNYIPQSEIINIWGEYKINRTEWVEFYRITQYEPINIEKLKDVLYDVYYRMNIRISRYVEISDLLKSINEIEINDEDE